MKSLNKKGFTIVELVIVIAVIAVLAAVLVPVITNVVNKANVSADTQLIRNLNTALSSDVADGQTHITMTDALAAANEYGYDVAKINTKADDNQILWDSVADAFCYLNDGEITYTPDVTGEKASDSVDLWIIADEPSAQYSTYLYNANASSYDNVTTGIDVGNENITSITYKNSGEAQDVVIRTNGGKLTIDAQNDTVAHYGVADKVVVTAVADSSYDEYGTVKGNIEVAKGHIVVKEGAKAESVLATANGVKVDIENEATEVKAASSITLGEVKGAITKVVTYVSTIAELTAADGEIVLNADLNTDNHINFNSGKTIILDANGHKITCGGVILVQSGTNLTIKGNGIFKKAEDKTAQLIQVGSPTSGTAGRLTIESGTFESLGACVFACNNKDNARSEVVINAGEFATHNYALGSNGTNTYQGADWTINGGTFNCYPAGVENKVACAVYVPNDDKFVINGGTFNIYNGAAIVCRSGNTTINKGLVINNINDGTITSGVVGDSPISLSVTSNIVLDKRANYPNGTPEVTNNSNYAVINIE